MYRPPVLCDGLAPTVRFDTGSAVIAEDDRAALSRLANQVACPNSNLVVAGFTDTSGSERFNVELSIERAQNVVEALREPFAAMLMPQSANAYAEEYPVVATADGVNEAANRRAEVFLGYRCSEREMIVKSLAPSEPLGNIADARPYARANGGIEPIRVTLHRRNIDGAVDPADVARLDDIAKALVRDLGASPAAIFPMLAGGACLAPGEDERIDIEY